MRTFNSTMVRLKDSKRHAQRSDTPFQFHYGTIKRLPALMYGDSLWSFNSTMVRLKVRCHDYSCYRSALSIPLWYD